MNSNNTLTLLIGILIGVILGGMVTLNGACNSKDHYDMVVRDFIGTIDRGYLYDVLMETDEWDNLNEYVDLSNY